MMNNIYQYLILLTLVMVGRTPTNFGAAIESCPVTDPINNSHSKAEQLQQKIDEIVAAGVPGAVIAVHDEEGYWAGSSGLAKIETETKMKICNLQYSQSIAKTYMATAILKLYEEDRINLDEKITTYLSENVASKITDADKITVRMLLNHTSGVPEYNMKPKYITYLLQHPLHTFSSIDYLNFIEGDPLQFNPGSDFRYTNTNYLLLALIGDQITGDHTEYLRNKILKSSGLDDTYYHNEGFLDQPDLVNSYWDRYSNGEIENCTKMQKTNVASLVGDDGVIATPIDYIRFLRALMTNQILADSTMVELFDFVQKNLDEPDGYGLGIHRDYYKGHPEIGHTGGGIGAGSLLGYFPDNDTYFFIGINIGTSIYSPNFDPLEDKINEIYDILLE